MGGGGAKHSLFLAIHKIQKECFVPCGLTWVPHGPLGPTLINQSNYLGRWGAMEPIFIYGWVPLCPNYYFNGFPKVPLWAYKPFSPSWGFFAERRSRRAGRRVCNLRRRAGNSQNSRRVLRTMWLNMGRQCIKVSGRFPVKGKPRAIRNECLHENKQWVNRNFAYMLDITFKTRDKPSTWFPPGNS